MARYKHVEARLGLDAYTKEIEDRVGLAEVFANFIATVKTNVRVRRSGARHRFSATAAQFCTRRTPR